MHTIQIDVSPNQLRKLKKGHKVRVKKGTGFELLVHPKTYNIVSRSFNKGKGSQIQLSPEELEMNKGIDKSISPEAHNPSLQPNVSTPARTLPASGPAVLPFPQAKTGSGIKPHRQLYEALNDHLGSNYGYLERAGMDNLLNAHKSAAMMKHGINSRYGMAPVQADLGPLGPHSRMVGGALERGSIGLKGGMLNAYMPPALVSQPFSANFQFQHFLPPQYQHFNSGGTFEGSGLYV